MQAVNIVIADAQATPVNHTFIPIGRDANGIFWFEDQSFANSVGYWRISVQTKRPPPNATNGSSANNRVYRTIVGFHEPTLEVQGPGAAPFVPAPTVAYVNRYNTEVVDPERSTVQNRADQAKMGPLIMQNSMIQTIMKTHEELSF